MKTDKLRVEEALEGIQALHRHGTHYVTFHRKTDSEWRDLGAAPACDLGTFLPGFFEQLAKDSYFGVNGYLPPPTKWRPGRPGLRGSSRVAVLTCLYADLDPRDQVFTDTLRDLFAAEKEKLIPPPTIIASSGRGAWGFWRLADTDGMPLPATPENRARWCCLQRALLQHISEHLPKLKPDLGASDLARVARLPGSVNTKSDSTVKYTVLCDREGHPFEYCLDEVRRFLKLPAEAPPHPHRITRSDGTGQSNRHGGWRSRYEATLAELDCLAVARGGIQEGSRSIFLVRYALFALRAGHGEEPSVLVTANTAGHLSPSMKCEMRSKEREDSRASLGEM